ncbi:MAG: ABC transporter permease subunit, partial [SAR324 cluster bacterium]|nr:ABC transporter permease subunit [SAR324 cluster bacterium]
SLWTVILGHTLVCTPFSIAILNYAFANMDMSLEEASLDLGERRFGTFKRVILPMVLPGLISSLLIAFTISLDEFIIAFFLTGTETTLPVYIWGQLRFPAKLPGVMALGFLMLLLSLVLLSLFEYFRRRMNRILEDQSNVQFDNLFKT